MNRACVILVAAMALGAGCAQPSQDDGRVETSLRILFSGQGDDVADKVDIDPGAPPTAAQYEVDGQDHPGFYTAHDQLVQWGEETGTAIEVELSPSFGYYLSRIGGAPEDTSAFYWSLGVNGTESMTGMTQVRVVEGSTITWTLTAI